MLSDLGLNLGVENSDAKTKRESLRSKTSPTTRSGVKRQRTGPRRGVVASAPAGRPARSLRRQVPKLRKSPRLHGNVASGTGPGNADAAVSEASDDGSSMMPSEEDVNVDNEIEFENEAAAELAEKCKMLMQAEPDGGKRDRRRRLFLVPTGKRGVNDHTLEEPVAEVDNMYLWGFCEGLFSRIFVNIRPGDIFLMTTAGEGAFNKIARVCETRVVSKFDADRFWKRMSFSMGGTSKNNVGFPLLTPVDKPIEIDWDKQETLRSFGYTDHLQASRWIKPEKMNTVRGSKIFADCLQELGLDPFLTDEELKLAEICPK